jgi:hypothetical protein
MLLLSGIGELLLVVDGKQQVVAETVPPVHAVSLPVKVDIRGLRQPHIQLPFTEVYWSILDHRAVCSQADHLHRRNQVRFQPHDLIGVRSNPRATLDGHRV